MRYKLENGTPAEVRKITVNGLTTTNPTDAQIDAADAGYPLEETPAPEYDAATQYPPTSVWALSDGVITKVWTVSNIPQDVLKARQIAAFQAQIDALNAGYESFKNAPQTFTNGKSYLPRWVPEFYTPLMTLGAAAFPQNVSASDGSSQSFSFEEFTALFAFLIQVSAAETARVNGLIADLQAQISALTEGETDAV